MLHRFLGLDKDSEVCIHVLLVLAQRGLLFLGSC